MKTFTDHQGNVYEECPIKSCDDHILIRPKQEKKKDYYLSLMVMEWREEELLSEYYSLTEQQAQDIAEALSETMKYITGDTLHYEHAVIKARTSYKEGR